MKIALALTVFALAAVSSAKSVVVYPENGEKTVNLGVGETLEVQFNQSSGTGYRWVLGDRQNDRILFFDRSDVVPGSGPRRPGGPTVQRFSFIAKTTGSAKISFDLYGPGQKKKSTSVGIQVQVSTPTSVIKVFATDSDDGSRYDLSRGQWLEVRLTTQPSTGYSWKLDPKSISAFTLRSNEVRNSKGGMPGQPTVQVFVLVVTKKGTDTPKFEYVGPDGRTVGKRYSITAQVRD
jgi:predicted secreted protein